MLYVHGKRRAAVLPVVVALVLGGGSWQGLAQAEAPSEEMIATGERLVHNMDCNVCHSPKIMTPQGPRPDPTRLLSGHPADEQIPPVPAGAVGPAAWGGLFNNGLTAWAGPWGVSFGTNLTPDRDSGIGTWTEEMFFAAMSTGTHQEQDRPFLPPMPTYSRLTRAEIAAIFAYLQSLDPVSNEVPEALPPAGSRP